MPTDPSRRDFLRTTAAGAAGLALAPTAAATTPPALSGKAKACIFINLIGGPSHLDTFDPKPDAPAEVRGPFRPIPTRVPGVYLSELFPTLAGMADKFSLVRSLHHTAPPIHEAGLQLLNTGRLFRDGPAWPNVGSVVEHLAPTGESYSTFHANGDVDTGIAVEKGFGPGWLPTPVCWAEFDRPELTHALWDTPARYGGSKFGRACHFTANLVASGTTRVASINHFDTVFDAPSWDCHADRGSLGTTLDDYRATVAPSFDTAFSALLVDLEERGLLDSTLVVAVGEFGRTPRLNANGGRDHWAGCWTALVAGGGVKGGRVVGASDAIGSEPADRPVTPQELVATAFHALGVPMGATIPGPDGAPADVYPAVPVAELF